MLVAAANTGKEINVKKVNLYLKNVLIKIESGNSKIYLTERGTTFGYNNLVVDMTSIIKMKNMDILLYLMLHSVQKPGGKDFNKEYVEYLAMQQLLLEQMLYF